MSAKVDYPRYFDALDKKWKPCRVPGSRSDRRRPCALCGWGKHMAIHEATEGSPPTGPFGIHAWVASQPAPQWEEK